MSNRLYRSGCIAVLSMLAGLLSAGVGRASAKPILMPTLAKEIQIQRQIWQQHTFAPAGALQPPAPPAGYCAGAGDDLPQPLPPQ